MKTKVVICAAGVLIGMVLLGIAVRTGHADQPARLRAGVTENQAVATVFARSCQDCHSDATRWPWYGHVPPAIWLLNRDISEARSHMDFSRWEKYSLDDKRKILTEIAATVRSHQMPPARYLFMHSDARLSASEVALLYSWAKGERRKLRAKEAPQP